MKTALLFPPQWYPSQPYLALPTLKAHLESKGHEVDQFDFNIESYEIFLSRGYLDHCVETVQKRLSLPAYTSEEQEVKAVYRDILSDKAFLDSILNEVEDAKNVLRDEERFFQFETYKKAYTTLKMAMKHFLRSLSQSVRSGLLFHDGQPGREPFRNSLGNGRPD